MVAVTGIGSGLDIEGIVTQLIAAERGPVESRLLQRATRLTSQLSAFGTFQGALSNLQTSITTLSRASTFTQRSVSSSDSDAITATARSNAAPGSFRVQVNNLAEAQSLASGRFDSLTDTVGEGPLTLRFGTVDVDPPAASPQSFNGFSVNGDRASVSITLDSSNNSLQGVRDAINAADAGVSAAIVDDGEGFRLLLSATQTGAANAVEIQVDDADGNDADTAGLSRLSFSAGANNLEQTVAGRDASFSVNGLQLTSDSNRVESVVDGVDLTLRQATEAAVTVSIDNNEGAVRSAIEGFVSSFNNFARVSGNLTAYNADAGTAGPLQGDITARSIVSQVRTALARPAQGFDGPFSTLAELGIRTQADGSLSIDESTFNAALRDNFDRIAGVFARVGDAADSTVQFVSSTDATRVGRFDIEVTRLASRGALQGAAIAAPTALAPLVIDGSNDSLSLTVDGVASGAISLTQGSFESGEALAAALQARINGAEPFADRGISVSVAFTADNRLEIRSARFGSRSTVELTAIDTQSTATLGLAVGAGTAGQDVAGTIGGVAATGNGQRLSGAVGSPAEGLVIDVTGGTTGARGTVNVSSGVAVALNGVLEGFLGSDGLLALRTDGLQGRVERIEEDREALNLRLEALEERFRRQFSALDPLLATLRPAAA